MSGNFSWNPEGPGVNIVRSLNPLPSSLYIQVLCKIMEGLKWSQGKPEIAVNWTESVFPFILSLTSLCWLYLLALKNIHIA